MKKAYFKTALSGVLSKGVYISVVRHDNTCPALQGSAECTCESECELMDSEQWLKMMEGEGHPKSLAPLHA